jgi:hypothetical protein
MVASAEQGPLRCFFSFGANGQVVGMALWLCWVGHPLECCGFHLLGYRNETGLTWWAELLSCHSVHTL